MKLKEVFEKSVQFFKDKKIETARLDAELLLAHVLKIDRLQIYLKYEQPLTEKEISDCREVVRRRSQGEPVAYIVGERGFYGEVYTVGPGVLIPRPETELIVEEVLKFINEQKIQNPRILDLGAGTGCIGFSILKNCEAASLVSVEKSPEAYRYLEINLKNLDLAARADIKLQDVMQFESVDKFDVIVANPPYIDVQDHAVEPNVRKFEPSSALFSEQNGLKDIVQWSKKAASLVKDSGAVFFEIGHLQGADTRKIFEGTGRFDNIQILKDLSALDRVVKATHN